jgi:uncharacterized protein (DUF1330 family)
MVTPPILEGWFSKKPSSGHAWARLTSAVSGRGPLRSKNLMNVYILVQLRFKDISAYQRYRAAFPAVFAQFNGRVLVADDAPVPLSGVLGWDKVVVMEFPDEREALRFIHSPPYREISVDFERGAEASFTLLKGVAPR